MKKIIGVLVAGLVCAAAAMPAAAVENEFGGYWRTRAISMQNFNGTDDPGTQSYVDTRTRLYYTAKFNDKFKFVNKFEIDNGWGDTVGGDIGADGKQFEIKNSYADFFVGENNFKVGIQPGKIARGFLFDDDFAGLTASFKVGSIMIPFMWMKVEDDDLGADPAKTDRDYMAVSPVININETLSVNPYLFIDKQQGMEAFADNAGKATAFGVFRNQTIDNLSIYLGVDINAKMDGMTAWGTFIYETGEVDYMSGLNKESSDISAFLIAAGADAGLVHGQFFYASGDDNLDDDCEQFGLHFTPGKGQTYYWAEIMGEGIFDGTRSNNAPGTKVSNIMAANIGATVKPMDKLTLTGDVWYAQLAEEVAGEDELGLEIDLKATYMLLDNLKLDVVAAYLIAGDATGDEDPIELGAQLSFSF